MLLKLAADIPILYGDDILSSDGIRLIKIFWN